MTTINYFIVGTLPLGIAAGNKLVGLTYHVNKLKVVMLIVAKHLSVILFSTLGT